MRAATLPLTALLLTALLLPSMLTGCAAPPSAREPGDLSATSEPLRSILRSRPALAPILAGAAQYRPQILLGWFEEGPDGRQVLRQAGFRDGGEYFYPASAVKLFAAIAALERLAELRRETGLDLGPDTPLAYHPLFEGELLVDRDETHLAGGTVTVRHEIRKLFLVSDNEAFNRLYELVGQDRLAASMARAGIIDARVVHRLAEPRSAEENRRSPRIDFRGAGFVHTVDERTSEPLDPAPEVIGLRIGDAYLAGDARVDGPMDFSTKNYFPLVELQRGLCRLVRPDADCGPGEPFALAEGDRELLLEAMRLYPRESADPVYDPAEYPDAWGKNLLPGLTRRIAQADLEIHNKTGRAYGFSVENAWVYDRVSGRGCFLAATIYTNADGVLNDDAYEYREVADPFFADLGEALAIWLRRPEAQAKNR